LKNNELYFSFPSEFNDPFDTKIEVEPKGEKHDWRSYLQEMEFDIPQEYIERILNLFKDYNYNIEEIPDVNKEDYFNFSKEIVILCLSEINNNILMWSHYSDNHEGVCLGFETTFISDSIGLEFNDRFQFHPAAKKGFLPSFRVNYKQEKPAPYNPLKDDKRKLFEFAKTKYLDWQYERERRIIYMHNDIRKQIINFKKEILSEIIFGLKTSQEDIDRIKEIVYEEYINKGYDVSFYKTELCKNEYGLQIVPFE
jgi:hypothetical protein